MSDAMSVMGDGVNPIVYAIIAMALTALFFGGCAGA